MMLGRILVRRSRPERIAGGNPRRQRRSEDLESRWGNLVLTELAERDESRVRGVRSRERMPPYVFAEHVDQDVVPADLAAFQLEEVPYVEHADRPHIDTGLFQGLPRRGSLDCFTDLHGPARETP